jgi:hypothetical protein
MKKFVALAYEALGLDPEGHEIGTMRFIDLPPEVFYTICAHHLEHVLWDLYEHWDEEELEEWDATAAANGFMLFKDWQHMLKNKRSYTFGNEQDTDYQKRFDAIVEWRALRLYNTHHYQPTFEGWQQYVCDASPHFALDLLLKEFPVRIPERTREEHTYLCGQTGSGKTELAKLLIHSYMIHQPDTALVIIEPSSKLSDEVARFRENYRSDRLIYVTYDRDHGLAPHINPLRISGLSPSDTSRRALDLKDTYADELVDALGEMIRAGGVQFTDHMQTALRRCLHVLLDKEGATLRDLVHFMNDAENDKLMDFALSRTHDPDGVSYFKTKFKAKESQIAQTKNSLYTRLDGLMGRALSAITCANDNLIDLEKEISAKKIIIFELSGRLGPRQGPAFGRLILAMLRAMALRRDELLRRNIEPVPVHVFVDECHNYVSTSIKKIREFRKFRVLLTLIQTELGAEMPPETKEAVLGATTLKIAGRAGEPHPVARVLRVDEGDIAGLDKAEFILRSSELPYPIRFKAHGHLANRSHSMTEQEWAKVWKRQLDTYYRPIEAPVPAQAVIPPAERPKPALAPETRGKRPPSNRRPARVPITEDENIF